MESVNFSRRRFMRGKIKSESVLPVRPPWTVSEALFTEHCTRCGDCIESCPEQIVFSGSGGYPEVNFGLGECTFCEDCVDACPEEKVFHPDQNGQFQEQAAWNLTANINKQCLLLNGVVCRACGDSCDYDAIAFVAKAQSLAEPQLNAENCTACGACISVCPVAAISIPSAVEQKD